MSLVLAGKCRVCGCTELNPCNVGDEIEGDLACSWIDFDHTLCSNLRCIASTPLVDLLAMAARQAIPMPARSGL